MTNFNSNQHPTPTLPKGEGEIPLLWRGRGGLKTHALRHCDGSAFDSAQAPRTAVSERSHAVSERSRRHPQSPTLRRAIPYANDLWAFSPNNTLHQQRGATPYGIKEQLICFKKV